MESTEYKTTWRTWWMMATTETVVVRRFRRNDAAGLLSLMKGLATFERYIDDFRVTEEDLCRHGLGDRALFQAFVAEDTVRQRLVGMAVTYVIPWTYDRQPTLILKELYVSEEARGFGVGRRLMTVVARRAESIGAGQLKWTVLPDNTDAQQFYQSLGGHPDVDWMPWQMDSDAIERLARSD